MRTISAIVVSILFSGCSLLPGHGEPQSDAGHKPMPRGTDQLCMNDCLGASGDPGFCRERCTQ